MFLMFFGVNDKIINFGSVALIEDQSTEEESKVTLTYTDGAEIEFIGSDADGILARAETILQATDEFLAKVQQANNTVH
jgi:hypothetical protein